MPLFRGTKEEPGLRERVVRKRGNSAKPLPQPSQKNLIKLESFLDRFKKDSAVLVVQPRLKPDIIVYTTLVKQYAKNTKRSFDQGSTVDIIMAALKIVSIIFDTNLGDRVKKKDYTIEDTKS